MKHSRVFLAVAAATLAAPSAAFAASALDEHEHGDEHEEDVGSNVLSLKLAGLEILSPASEESGGPVRGEEAEAEEGEGEEHVLGRVGVSIGVERVIVPGWLEAEVSVLIAPGEGGITLPIDLVIKKPFEFSHELEAFIGVGLATSWLKAGESETAYGAASQAGVYYWMDKHFALAFEGEYNLLLSPETEHEFVLASGGAFRF
ncbi:MAG TPA: hypothetical protein VMG12_00610 [Polyangiaceae bacterium]|nr:hypothetical protein [Polyangiaceae bacterium]